MRDTDYNWGAEEWRQPTPAEGDTVLYSEHGRVMPGSGDGSIVGRGIDCRSHSFKLVKAEYGGAYLLVKHGGGEERIKLGWNHKRLAAIFDPLDSDARYWLLHTFLTFHDDVQREASQSTATRYAEAFAEGRLKKRRRNGRVIVEIVPRAATVAA